MTVKELIKELEQIENKELDVVVLSFLDGKLTTDIELTHTVKYYGKIENGWTAKDRECIIIE